MQLCGEIPRTCNGIQLEINNAYVIIERRDDVKNIDVYSSCADKWMVDNSVIKHANAVQQQAVFISKADCQMFAAQGKIQSVLVSRAGQSATLSSCHDMNMVNNQLFVNGTRTILKSGKTTFDVAPRDEIHVVVPRDYRGFIELKICGNSRISIDEWQAGAVRILMAAAARAVFQAGKLLDLTTFSIKSIGKNPRYNIKATIDSVDAELVDIQLGNVGRVNLKHLKTDRLKASTLGAALDVTGFASDFELGDFGTGRVTLDGGADGSFGILKRLVTGPQGAEFEFLP